LARRCCDTMAAKMNLWADFDDKQHSALNAGSLKRPRRLTEQVVLSTLRTWLLSAYVPAYCRALANTRIFRRCYWVDALGGHGRASSEPTTAQEGEPITGKRTAQDAALHALVALSHALAQESRSITLHGLLLAAESRKRARSDAGLSAHMPKGNGNGVVSVLPASWLEAAVSVLSEIDQAPALFLLNPFGKTLFSYEQLAPLYQRTVPTELLFFLPHRQLLQHLQAAQHIPAQAAALTALVRSDRWKGLPQQEEEAEQAIAGLNEMLIASMQRHFQLPVQRIMLPMLLRSAVVEQIPYTLLFATRRSDSLLSMNDALCSYERATSSEQYRGLLNETWFMQQQEQQLSDARHQALQHIANLGRAQRTRRWPDLRQQVLLAHFGLLTTAEYDQLIQQLLRQGTVRCEWKRPLPASDTAEGHTQERVPGSEDLLLWT
jgi:hypothetical protein